MATTLFLVSRIGAALVIGALIGYGLYRLKNMRPGSFNKAIKNPEFLAEKLKEHGKIIDMGHEVEISTKVDDKLKVRLDVKTRPEKTTSPIITTEPGAKKKTPPEPKKPPKRPPRKAPKPKKI